MAEYGLTEKVYTKEMHMKLDQSVKIMFKNIEEQMKSELLCNKNINQFVYTSRF
jgi:phosphoribosylformylglycinamidine (FGAM) synthase PurS component